MIFPPSGTAPLPNPDLPEDVKALYEEAFFIAALSPRAACALLRVSIDKLCTHLGEKDKDLNKKIGSLVKKGLPVKIQQSLDVVRIVANSLLHPGEIDFKDTPEIAAKLFVLVNLIAEYVISSPNQVSKLYEEMPRPQKEAIKKRDAGTQTAT